VVSDDRGRRIEILEAPTPEDAARVRTEGIRTAWIQGFGMSDLPDLSLFDGLIDDLNVVTLNLRSDAAVQSLPRLRSLWLQSYARNPLDLGTFEQLEDLSILWRPGAPKVFELQSLRSLSIANYPYVDLAPLANLKHLRRLTVRNNRKLASLNGIQALGELTDLALIDDQALVTLEPLGGSPCRLRTLKVQHCRKVTSLEPLRGQIELEELQVTAGGRIDSLAPLTGLATLRAFWFYESTVVADGDLSVLVNLPSLVETAFQDRRHYSHRVADVEAYLAAKSSDGARTRDIARR
jgi:hypothetical protein